MNKRNFERKAQKLNVMHIPTRDEINVYNSPDEQCACKNFLGKNLDEAQELFADNSLTFQEDLMWMGPIAFNFYVNAAIRYIQSKSAKHDSDIINCFADILEFRLAHGQKELEPVSELLAAACRYIIDNWSIFDVSHEIYTGLSERYIELEQVFINMKNKA